MWLIGQNAILTKDNMRKVNGMEIPHAISVINRSLFNIYFDYITAKVVWGVIGRWLRSPCRPGNFIQYFHWIRNLVPNGYAFFEIGLAAVCWSIWKCGSWTCFVKKMIGSPVEVVYGICSFIRYWAGHQNDEGKEMLLGGSELLLVAASQVRQSGGRPLLAAQLGDEAWRWRLLEANFFGSDDMLG